MNKEIWPAAASFAAIAGIMLYFIALSPLMADNFVFSKAISPGFAQFYSGHAITAKDLTLASAFQQAAEMYQTWCGRFTGNLAVYLLFMLPRWAYCPLAALAFAFYIWLLQMCVFGRGWRAHLSPAWILGLAAMIWAGMPSFGEAFLWLGVGGQIALLGQAAIFLPFRFALDGPGQPRPFLRETLLAALLLLLGAAAASMDYATSAALPPTGLACALWLYFRQKAGARKIPWQPVWTTIGLGLGAALTLGAPGNAERLRLTHDQAVHAWLSAGWGERIMDWLGHLPGAIIQEYAPLVLLAWGIAALAGHYGRSWLKHLPAAAWLFLLPALLTVGSYLFTAWPPARAFATVNIQLLLCACAVLVAAWPAAGKGTRSLFKALAAALCVFCAASLPLEAWKFYSMHKIIQARTEILSSAGPSVILDALPPNQDGRYWVLGGNLPDVAQDADFWVNRAVAAHYGLDKVERAPLPARNFSTRALPENTGLLKVSIQKDRICVAAKNRTGAGKLFFYYYGKPALLDYFPEFVGKFVFSWLAEGEAGAWREKLVPLLLARVDIAMRDGKGQSEFLKMRADSAIWLVRPGAGMYSFNLFPLRAE